MENKSICTKEEKFSDAEESGINEGEHFVDEPDEGDSDQDEERVFLAGSIKVEYPDDYEYNYKTECNSDSVSEPDDNHADPVELEKIEKNPRRACFEADSKSTLDNASYLPYFPPKRSVQGTFGGASSDEDVIRTPSPGTSKAYGTDELTLPTRESVNAQHFISASEHAVEDYDMSSGHFMAPSPAILPASFTPQSSSFVAQPAIFITQPSFLIADNVAVEERNQVEGTGERSVPIVRNDLEFLREVKSNFSNRTGYMKRLFQCEVCKRRFPFKSNLIAHQRQHSGEKPYRCDQCPKTFAGKYGLIGHLRKHTGEKPFKCDLCGRQFAHLSGLRYHERTHDEEKLFSCHVCGQKYTQKANLESHMRKHPGEKPYQCEECNKWFRHKIHLKIHKREHRRNRYGAVDTSECEIIDLEFSEN